MIGIAVVGLAVAIGQDASPLLFDTPAGEIELVAEAMREGLDASLRDYPRSRYRDVVVYTAPGTNRRNYRACGLVNAPNAYGAMAGWERFSVAVSIVADTGEPWGPARVRIASSESSAAERLANDAMLTTDCPAERPPSQAVAPISAADLAPR